MEHLSIEVLNSSGLTLIRLGLHIDVIQGQSIYVVHVSRGPELEGGRGLDILLIRLRKNFRSTNVTTLCSVAARYLPSWVLTLLFLNLWGPSSTLAGSYALCYNNESLACCSPARYFSTHHLRFLKIKFLNDISEEALKRSHTPSLNRTLTPKVPSFTSFKWSQAGKLSDPSTYRTMTSKPNSDSMIRGIHLQLIVRMLWLTLIIF